MSSVKWKYCAIKSDLGVKYFNEKGEHGVRKFEEEENKDFHKMIAELGVEGWELVSSIIDDPMYSTSTFVFKRPIDE